jgi:hypothetical protein
MNEGEHFMKWYRVYYNKIEPVEVIRETTDFVVVASMYPHGRETRSKKIGIWGESYHPTFKQAKDYLMATFQKKLDAAQDTVIEFSGKMKALAALREQDEK